MGSSIGAWDTGQGHTQRYACNTATVILAPGCIRPYTAAPQKLQVCGSAPPPTQKLMRQHSDSDSHWVHEHGAAQHGVTVMSCCHHALGTEPSKDQSAWVEPRAGPRSSPGDYLSPTGTKSQCPLHGMHLSHHQPPEHSSMVPRGSQKPHEAQQHRCLGTASSPRFPI